MSRFATEKSAKSTSLTADYRSKPWPVSARGHTGRPTFAKVPTVPHEHRLPEAVLE